MRNKNQKRFPARVERFIREYAIDVNGKAAAIRAGYSAKSAEVTASRLLRDEKVRAAADELLEREAAQRGITAGRVLKELEALAFSDVSNYKVTFDGHVELTDKAPRNAMRAVASIKYRVKVTETGDSIHETELKLWDKPGPLKLAGRHVGLFPDRVDDDRVQEAAERMMRRAVENAKRDLDNPTEG